MSYIIKNSDPFVSVKLTEVGREALAKGELNFAFWGVGDSEINYDREAIVDPTDVTLSATSKILRPKDRQPDIKSFVSTGGDDPLNILSGANIRVIKAIVNNEAEERGFFSGDPSTSFTSLTGLTKDSGTFTDAEISGGTTLVLGTGSTAVECDYILIKLTNPTLGTLVADSNTDAIPHLWYKIQALSAGTATVDRELPNLDGSGGTAIQYYIYSKGEVADVYGASSTTAYWDTGTLQFNSSCDISCADVDVWNMNNVWCESLAGTTGTSFEGYTRYGSFPYFGTKEPYLEFDCSGTGDSITNICEGLSTFDSASKSVSIIHYTNNTISNFYGEFFHIDNSVDKTVHLHYPDLMYHRRSGTTESGVTMGMSFIASGDVKTVGTSDIEYVDLIEYPSLIAAGTTPQIVGRVFPQLKIVVVSDEEVVAATSYKSNRSWSLPVMEANLAAPSGGTSTGITIANETMYLTYALENSTGTGLTTSLACQKYAKITNSTAVPKDVEFKIADLDLLPYMRKIEKAGYDGRGFHGYNLKVVYQIVSDPDDRPDPANWKVADFTTTAITSVAGETIDPVLLQNQNPATNGFRLTSIKDAAATTYDITGPLSMAPLVSPENLQFGDERFFYGNIETFIGATIYKTIFDLRINGSQFNTTTNPTRSQDPSTNPPNIRVSEVGIYDSNRNLVLTGKLNTPVELTVGNTLLIEPSIDM